MFCSKCGMKNEDGAQFCSGCGAALIGGQSGEEIQQRQSEREELMKKLQQILPGLQSVETMDEKIQNLEEEQQTLSARSKGKLGRNIGIFLGVYFASMCIWGGLIYATFSGTNDPFAAVVILGTLILAGGITIIVLSHNANYKRCMAQINSITDMKHDLEKNREIAVKKLLPEIQFVPANYRYLIAVQYMLEAFQNQRADTFKEAINLYEEQLHRWKLENASAQMLTLQRQQMSELNRINANTTVSAVANTVTAFNTRR